LRLYNSLSQRVEDFEPQAEAVTIYVCGITPYDTTHLGHAFTYATTDLLIRYLEHSGRKVRYVQNVTDIDDDILKRAASVGEDWKALGNRWTAHFIRDMQALNVRPPDHFPRATDVIEDIVDTVSALLDADVAYERGGSVYFDIDRFEAFGQLSHLPRPEMLPIANERGNHPDDPNKRQPLDFVLWQAAVEGEPSWRSPWGMGRPGWHIECSTMATHLLGDTIDVHGGGSDLMFPHHECEIAQVEPITRQRPFVRTWMHTAMVRHQGEKMSKSLGNLVMVRDLLEDVSPNALRLYLGRHHYRLVWAFDQAELEAAVGLADKLEAAVRLVGQGQGASLSPESAIQAFKASLDDDLQPGPALEALEALADSIMEAAQQGARVAEAQSALQDLARVFGLHLGSPGPEERVVAGWSEHLKRFEDASTA
jgi:L-cysteine:1D-myo-inositol 2-amino-2-deoxy-alpha-D-glucopyranoside ligase